MRCLHKATSTSRATGRSSSRFSSAARGDAATTDPCSDSACRTVSALTAHSVDTLRAFPLRYAEQSMPTLPFWLLPPSDLGLRAAIASCWRRAG
jgi:hypothetical protein